MAVYGVHRTIIILAPVSHCRNCVFSCKNMAHALSDALCFVVCTSEYVIMSETQYVAARLTKATPYLRTYHIKTETVIENCTTGTKEVQFISKEHDTSAVNGVATEKFHLQ